MPAADGFVLDEFAGDSGVFESEQSGRFGEVDGFRLAGSFFGEPVDAVEELFERDSGGGWCGFL